jgi:hypothetical protein
LKRLSEQGKAGNRIRTGDLLITSQLLYQLSYAGTWQRKAQRLPVILFRLNRNFFVAHSQRATKTYVQQTAFLFEH